jgi:hypothetical protein
MALKSCPECGITISTSAATCPACGAKQRKYTTGEHLTLGLGDTLRDLSILGGPAYDRRPRQKRVPRL